MSSDPHFQRESEKYENPVASREFLLSVIEKAQKPLSFIEICRLVNAKNELEQVGVQRRLRAMEREGQLAFGKDKKYELQALDEIKTGRVIGHRDGFGFVTFESDDKDWYLSPFQMKNLMHGDIVEVVEKGLDRKGRVEARVTQIITPRTEHIVGRFFVEHGVALVIPDDSRINHEIFIGPQDTQGARQGHVVVIKITKRPSKQSSPAGKVIEILGEHMAPGMEIERAIRAYDIPHEWPDAVSRYVSQLDSEVSDKDKVGRKDLRELPLVTIDGEDARDFDDAVYALKKDTGDFVLYVAIADVSAYVRPGTALDNEAINRATSVYFPEQVVPMLPEVLSNGLCSLNPDVDRLCMVCEMQISAQGDISHYEFYEAVMRSQVRFTYNKVAAILEGDDTLTQRYADNVNALTDLYDLYKVLKRARDGRGAIEFETRENKFIFNAQRKIDHIIPIQRNDAHKLIEECMISANVCAANMLSKHEAMGLYRIHDKPDADRMLTFTTYLTEVGVSHQLGSDTSSKALTHIVSKIRGRADAEVIQSMLLRSMKQAQYDYQNIGHFGLALDEYAHFTSPIRRYPDLVVHRAIKAILKKQKHATTGHKQYSVTEVEQLGEQCSLAERRADDATRDVADWLKCEFMQDHIGDEFDAVIASVTNFGLFVRILDFGIDGLVHVTALGNDYYHYDDVRQCLVGEASGRVFRLGDNVEVKVAAVNLDERKIDLLLVNAGTEKVPRKKSRRKTASGSTSRDAKKAEQAPPKPGKKRTSSREKKKNKQSKRKRK